MFESRITARTLEPTVQSGWITGNLTAAVVAKSPSTSLSAAEVARVREIRAQAEAIREDPTAEQVGVAQLAWAKREVQAALAKGKKWVLFGHGTPMFDRFFYDYEAAIENKRRTDPATAAQWEAVYKNITQVAGATVPSTGTM